MAQRSARARSKLDKISNANGPPLSSADHQRRPGYGLGGGARLGSGGLLTPSASSVSGASSSRNSLQLNSAPRVQKGTLRSFLEGQGEKIRRGFVHGHKREGSDNSGGNFYTGLGGGVGVGPGMGAMRTIEEKVQVKRWEGSNSKGELWDGGGKGKKDLELWFPDGDTLVYLTERPLDSRNPQGLYKPPVPSPSFRLRSSVLRETGSPYLISQLEESTRQPTVSAMEPPPTPQESEAMEYEYQLQRTRTLEMTTSETLSMKTNTTAATDDSFETGVKYRLYFPAPARLDKSAKHRYHLTTRNFFGVLFNKSLVGITLSKALLDLMERIDRYLSASPNMYDMAERGIGEIESPYGSLLGTGPARQARAGSHPSTHRIIIDYLKNREFDDVRNWTEGAAALLIFAEKVAARQESVPLSPADVQWVESLWRECYVHCTGQLSVLQCKPEWLGLHPVTKALIDRNGLEIQVRTSNADARLAGFSYSDMWPITSAGVPSARLAFDKFQKFLLKHYHSRFGSWPPQEGRFSRTLYLHLQRDFAALYDYLVDNEAVWSPPHNVPSSTGRRIVKPNILHWRADDDQLQITDILRLFDDREGNPPIPHPFPLVPASAGTRLGNHTGISAGSSPNQNKRQQRFFPSAATSGLRGRQSSNPAAALALSESTNIEALYSSKTINPLVEAFTAHEKSVPSADISPHDARKGRWILIYGILQTLASVSVDAPGIKWTEGVEYFLNPKLSNTPPWKYPPGTTRDESGSEERSHYRSHCWTTNSSRTTAAQPALPILAPATTPATVVVPTITAPRHRPRHRSQSRSRKQAARERRLADKDSMDTDSHSRNQWSGDEGDDEMEGAGSPSSNDSPPPPMLRHHNSRGVFAEKSAATAPSIGHKRSAIDVDEEFKQFAAAGVPDLE
ncbi:hypothetical protein EDC01DRAFT_472813 [Geopyxis carbonaria]|nr:hypothetical protein EDC01DRAFT_472813 [Geopyxis carbonaria]